MPGSAPLSRLAGWLAIVAMAANLCVGMAAARVATEPPDDAPSCCCGEGCACGPTCACSVAPADPAEHRPETPATIAVAIKPVPVAMPTERAMSIASSASHAGATPTRCGVGFAAAGQREIRLRTGICTT